MFEKYSHFNNIVNSRRAECCVLQFSHLLQIRLIRAAHITPYPQSIFDRQRHRALNTRRALCVEPAERFLLALEL